MDDIPHPGDEFAPSDPSTRLITPMVQVIPLPTAATARGISHRSNLVMEKEVISACLLDDAAMNRARLRLKAEHLYSVDHRRIWVAMLECYARKGMVDHPTISTMLANEHGIASGHSWIQVFADRCGSTQHVDAYIYEILSCWSVREAEDMIRRVETMVLDSTMQANDRISKMAAEMDGYRSMCSIENTDASLASSVIADVMVEVAEAEAAIRDGRAVSFRSGWPSLDDACKPRRSHLMAIMATRGQGKSSLAVNGYVAEACKAGLRSAVYSYEMPARQVMGRILAGGCGIPYSDQTGGRMTPEQHGDLAGIACVVDRWPLHIVSESSWGIDRVASHAHQLAREHGSLDVVVVDYIQLIANPGMEGVANLDYTSRMLKTLAKDLDCLVIGISQPTAAASRSGGRPKMSDAKGSGSIPDDADWFLVVYRPAINDTDTSESARAEAYVDKAREGQPGGIAYGTFSGERMRFQDAQWRDR